MQRLAVIVQGIIFRHRTSRCRLDRWSVIIRVSGILNRLVLDSICVGGRVEVLILAEERCDLTFQLLTHLAVHVYVLDREGDY